MGFLKFGETLFRTHPRKIYFGQKSRPNHSKIHKKYFLFCEMLNKTIFSLQSCSEELNKYILF